jgi:NADH dehydrogenase
VAAAIAGAHAAVNAVSLYVEHGNETFRTVHVDCARRIATLARQIGLEALVHISGIGADAGSRSPYIRSRGEGERAVQIAFPDAILVRPTVMFGPGDAFLTRILSLLRRLPVYPLFGSGQTRLQPAYVEDVAEAVARVLERPAAGSTTFECGGPRIYSYEDLLRSIARAAGLKPVFLPMPFGIWHALAQLAELLPHPPVTRNQVELMRHDNVVSAQMPGFGELEISPQSVEDIVPLLLRNG